MVTGSKGIAACLALLVMTVACTTDDAPQAASDLLEDMRTAMSAVESYRFEVRSVGPNDSTILHHRGLWAAPDKSRFQAIDPEGNLVQEGIATSERQLYRSKDRGPWEEYAPPRPREKLSYGDISGLEILEARRRECSGEEANTDELVCLVALVNLQGESSTFKQFFEFEMNPDTDLLLRWIRYEGPIVGDARLDEILSHEPPYDFASIGRTSFDYSDHGVRMPDGTFAPGS